MELFDDFVITELWHFCKPCGCPAVQSSEVLLLCNIVLDCVHVADILEPHVGHSLSVYTLRVMELLLDDRPLLPHLQPLSSLVHFLHIFVLQLGELLVEHVLVCFRILKRLDSLLTSHGLVFEFPFQLVGVVSVVTLAFSHLLVVVSPSLLELLVGAKHPLVGHSELFISLFRLLGKSVKV